MVKLAISLFGNILDPFHMTYCQPYGWGIKSPKKDIREVKNNLFHYEGIRNNKQFNQSMKPKHVQKWYHCRYVFNAIRHMYGYRQQFRKILIQDNYLATNHKHSFIFLEKYREAVILFRGKGSQSLFVSRKKLHQSENHLLIY